MKLYKTLTIQLSKSHHSEDTYREHSLCHASVELLSVSVFKSHDELLCIESSVELNIQE